MKSKKEKNPQVSSDKIQYAQIKTTYWFCNSGKLIEGIKVF